jgi:arylsulfatase
VLHGIGNVLALREGDWKYIPANRDTATGIGRGADPRDQRFAPARVEEDLLFNLAEDPGETTNLAATHPEKLAELRARLAAIRQ